jgi:hypothetical protein
MSGSSLPFLTVIECIDGRGMSNVDEINMMALSLFACVSSISITCFVKSLRFARDMTLLVAIYEFMIHLRVFA